MADSRYVRIDRKENWMILTIKFAGDDWAQRSSLVRWVLYYTVVPINRSNEGK